MATNQPGARGIDTRTEVLDEPTGTIEFGPRHERAQESTGEDYKPGSSSYVGGHEKNAVRKAEERQRDRRGGFLRGLWKRMRRGLGV
jgi:hypothetical protein